MHGNGLDLLPEEAVDEDENTLDDISGDEVSHFCHFPSKPRRRETVKRGNIPDLKKEGGEYDIDI